MGKEIWKILKFDRYQSCGKESISSAGDHGSMPGLWRALEKGMSTQCSVLAWRIPMDRWAWRATVTKSHKESDTIEYSAEHIHVHGLYYYKKIYTIGIVYTLNIAFLHSNTRWSRSVMSNSLQPCGLYPTRLLHPWDFLSKGTGVGCHFLLPGIFLTQGSNPGLPHCRQTLYHLSH